MCQGVRGTYRCKGGHCVCVCAYIQYMPVCTVTALLNTAIDQLIMYICVLYPRTYSSYISPTYIGCLLPGCTLSRTSGLWVKRSNYPSLGSKQWVLCQGTVGATEGKGEMNGDYAFICIVKCTFVVFYILI